MIYATFKSLFRMAAGRDCRCCAEPILPADAFGQSEGVCAGCRS